MFNLYTGNDAAVLADGLGQRLCAQAHGNPLLPAIVLVPQAGLRRWLQVHLAEKLGVVANVEFIEPARFAWQLLRAARPDLPRQSPFEPDVLRWHLYALLGEPLAGDALAPLRGYLAADGDPLRRYALGGELAHVFERMQGYRRGKLLRWEQGADPGDWQAELWRRLVARTGGASRATRVNEWLQRYGGSDAGGAPPGLPQHVHAFACANVSPDVLRMLGVAARHCELDFHLPLPTREYLGDVPRTRREVRERLAGATGENPLLLSMGGAAREFFNLLYGYEDAQPDDEIDAFDDGIDRGTLLGRVRDDLLNHRAPDADERVALPDDGSLHFRACHTPLREVQTLHDALLDMFAADATLQPRDIAVMMPDVAAYRPAIEAVFGGLQEADPRFIAYNVGDVAIGAAHPAARLFLTLLDAPASRWELGEILDTLAAPGVMRRLGLDADALEQLWRQLREAGVRWGEDEHARAACGGYREFSFAFGLDRMLAGFACGDDEDTLVGGVAPLAGVEGAAFGRLDPLLAVLDAWRRLRAMSGRARHASDWQRALNETFDGLYASDADDIAEARALALMRGALERLAEDTAAAGLERPLAWHDVRAFLRGRLDQVDARQPLFAGGVTFCGMVPLRVVPFRAICLLGMDEGAFPRRDAGGLDPLVADRRAGRRERGDRSVRDDDRLLFLQLIAAARDTLYISWIGRDPRTGKHLPPSVVVAELLDAILEGYLLQPTDIDAKKKRDEWLPRVQPLHAFDAGLFDGKLPRSYRREWLPAAATPAQRIDDSAPFVHGVLPQREAADDEAPTLEALQRYFADPARGYLQRALGMHWPRDDDGEDADEEPLAPGDGLLRYTLVNELLRATPGDAAQVAAVAQVLQARGKLPPGHFAQAAFDAALARAGQLRELVARCTTGEPASAVATHAVTLGDDAVLSGRLEGVHPRGLLRIVGARLHGKHVLRAWLDALFAFACGAADQAWLVGFDDKDKPVALAMPRLDAGEATAKLGEFVALHRRGLRAPLPLFPKTSWKCMHPLHRDGPADRADFIAALREGFDTARNEDRFERSELDDSAIRTVWRGIEVPGPADGDLAGRAFDLAQLACPQCITVRDGEPA